MSFDLCEVVKKYYIYKMRIFYKGKKDEIKNNSSK